MEIYLGAVVVRRVRFNVGRDRGGSALGALKRLSKRGIHKIVSAGVAMDPAERRKLPLSGAASTDDETPVTEE